MTVAGHLARGRARHQLLMIDACTVSRPGTKVYDAAADTYDIPLTTVYTGACRIVVWRGNEVEAADVEQNVTRYKVDLPLVPATPLLRRRDVLTVTASQNQQLVGAVITITEVQLDTTATSLRLIGEVAT